MKIFKIIFLLSIIVNYYAILSGQSIKKEIISFNGKSYGIEDFREYCEFKGIYPREKSGDAGVEKALEDFAIQVIKYEMAIKQGLDQTDDIIQNKEKIRKEYHDSSLNFEQVNSDEIKEAYYRLANQRKVSHIQVNLPEIPYPADTLEPYRKITELHSRLKNGEDFNELAYLHSENFVTVNDSGHIGDVSFATLNYPMELLAFKTMPGEYTLPFQTWAGYQIIKVHSEKPITGFMEIAHIAKKLSPGDTAGNEKTISLMDSLRNLILGGRRFEQLVRSYSEDTESAMRDGYLGSISPAFQFKKMADAAYSIENDGKISPLVVMEHSVHIIKRLRFNPIPEYEMVKDSLRRELAGNQARSYFRKQLYYNTIKSRSNFVGYPLNVNDFLMLGRTSLYQGRWISPHDSLLAKILFSVDNKIYTYHDLSQQMMKGNYPYKIVNYRPLIWKHYLAFEEKALNEYIDKNFEKVFPEVEARIKWKNISHLSEVLTEQEVLQKLSYSQKELKKTYSKNKKKYTSDEASEPVLNFDTAFPRVLSDYQKEAVRKWEKSLLKSNKVKINRKNIPVILQD